jgi:hypothetical protein
VGVSLAASSERDADAPLAKDAAASLNAVSRAEPAKPAPVAAAQPPAAKTVAPKAAPEPVALVARAEPVEPAPQDETVEEHDDGSGAIDPARARANQLVNVGHRLRKEGRWGMAEASYLKALKEMPTYARAISGLVQVHLGRRDGAEAVRWAKKLVALQSKPGVHHRLLGDAYALAGDKTGARKAWQQGSRQGDRVARERLKK